MANSEYIDIDVQKIHRFKAINKDHPKDFKKAAAVVQIFSDE